MKSIRGLLGSFIVASSIMLFTPGTWSATTSKSGTDISPAAERAGHSQNSPPAAKAGQTHRVDLNSATAAELETLPGVGATTAKAIVSARPFRKVEDLKNVKGIGDTRYEQLRPLVTVRPNGAQTASSVPVRSSAGAAPAGSQGKSVEAKSNSSARHAGTAGTATLGKGAEQKATSNTAGTKININTASKQEIESLLGIGPVKAQAIIDNRPYKSVDDIMNVKGIKEGTFAEIKDRIRVN